jgi:hypothetical protein
VPELLLALDLASDSTISPDGRQQNHLEHTMRNSLQFYNHANHHGGTVLPACREVSQLHKLRTREPRSLYVYYFVSNPKSTSDSFGRSCKLEHDCSDARSSPARTPSFGGTKVTPTEPPENQQPKLIRKGG